MNDDDDDAFDNREQDDDDQAQSVAVEALAQGDVYHDGESKHSRGNIAAIIPEDTPDVVDKMNEMLQSGRLDYDAFAGEPQHDDEENIRGNTDEDD